MATNSSALFGIVGVVLPLTCFACTATSEGAETGLDAGASSQSNTNIAPPPSDVLTAVEPSATEEPSTTAPSASAGETTAGDAGAGSAAPASELSPTTAPFTSGDESLGNDAGDLVADGGIEAGAGDAQSPPLPPSTDSLYFVPDGVPNVEGAGDEGGLTLVAFTLRNGANGPECFVAVSNEGEKPLCQVGAIISVFDKTEQQVATLTGNLVGGHPYRLADGDMLVSCIAPGALAMAALRGLPEPLVVEDLARMEHRFPYFDVDVVSVDGELSVNSVQTLASGSGFVYHGTVSNGFDVAVGGPSVTLFAVNQVGRPVGIATSTLPDGIPAGGNAPFETTALSDPGVGYVAFAEAALLP